MNQSFHTIQINWGENIYFIEKVPEITIKEDREKKYLKLIIDKFKEKLGLIISEKDLVYASENKQISLRVKISLKSSSKVKTKEETKETKETKEKESKVYQKLHTYKYYLNLPFELSEDFLLSFIGLGNKIIL